MEFSIGEMSVFENMKREWVYGSFGSKNTLGTCEFGYFVEVVCMLDPEIYNIDPKYMFANLKNINFLQVECIYEKGMDYK